MARAGQAVAQGADHQPAYEARIAEAHLGLGRMDVDVELVRVEVEVERRQRMAVARQEIGVGGAQGPLKQAVAHRASVDEQVLVGRVAPREGRQARVARQAHALARLVDQEGVVLEVLAQHRRQPLEPPLWPRMLGAEAQHPPAVDVEREGHRLVRHGLALDLFGDGHGLGPLGLHELQPRGGGEEQVAHLHPRAVRAGEGGGLRLADQAALHHQGVGVAAGFGPRGQGQAGDRADRGQGLAAEAQGGDVQQVPLAVGVWRELGGGVALHGQGQFFAVQAAAVVGHQDAGKAALVDLDLDARSAGVERVLDQLLDGAGGALDHLAGGDAVDGLRREAADRHGESCGVRLAPHGPSS